MVALNYSPFLSHHLFLTGSKSSKFADIVNLHIRADLRCLKVFIRGQKARISEISIEGMKMLLHDSNDIKFSPCTLHFYVLFLFQYL